jgi:hypothetical protein
VYLKSKKNEMKAKSHYIVILFVIVISFISCNKKDELFLDKQIRITIGNIGTGQFDFTDTIWQIKNRPDYIIPTFNIKNYYGIDSIIFIASISKNCVVELYNMTDNIAIDSSQIKMVNLKNTFQSSGNLLKYFPKKSINLGFRAKKLNGEYSSIYGNMYIMLYR